ncbi:MAG: bacteriohemerythrin [Pseudomonadota bacterium]
MALIIWTNELSVGIKSIDEQHKNLINMINALNDALADGSANEIIHEIFDGLAVYTITHMNYEEKLLDQYGYTQSAKHTTEHEILKERVAELQKKMDDGDFMIAIEVLSFLKDWLTEHILKTDMAYSEFLISKGVK